MVNTKGVRCVSSQMMLSDNLGSEHAFSVVKFHNVKGPLISNKP